MKKSGPPEITPEKSIGPSPPGRLKIMKALRDLLEEKEFSAITWADIARTAGVNEGLIYKYFKDTRNLLHEVLKEFLRPYLARMQRELKGQKGALERLRNLRQIIIGSVEHCCLPGVIFRKKWSPAALTEDLCTILLKGIQKR